MIGPVFNSWAWKWERFNCRVEAHRFSESHLSRPAQELLPYLDKPFVFLGHGLVVTKVDPMTPLRCSS
jgi:hypothetical protein